MKIKHLYLFILIAFLSACTKERENVEPVNEKTNPAPAPLAPCPQKYYYKNGQKVFVSVSDTMVAVAFEGVTPSVKVSTLNSFGFLQPVDTFITNNMFMFQVKFKGQENCHTVKTKSDLMEQNPNIAFVSPVINGRWSYTDEFIVKLKSPNHIQLLKQLALANNCNYVEDIGINAHVLTVNKTSSKDALDMANLFYETGNFEWAEPNVIW